MTRNYGVANIDGVDYCVMTLMKKENKANRGNGKADSYRYYVCPLKIDGEDYTAKIVVGKKNGSSYYDHRLTQIEKGELIDSLNEIAKPVAANNSPLLSGYKDKRLLSILQTNPEEIAQAEARMREIERRHSRQNANEAATETLRMVEAEQNDGSRYYDHKLTQIEKGKLISSLNRLSNSVAENEASLISEDKDSDISSTVQEKLKKVLKINLRYKALETLKRQAEREGGHILILPSDNSKEAGGLSSRTLDLSSACKFTKRF